MNGCFLIAFVYICTTYRTYQKYNNVNNFDDVGLLSVALVYTLIDRFKFNCD